MKKNLYSNGWYFQHLDTHWTNLTLNKNSTLQNAAKSNSPVSPEDRAYQTTLTQGEHVNFTQTGLPHGGTEPRTFLLRGTIAKHDTAVTPLCHTVHTVLMTGLLEILNLDIMQMLQVFLIFSWLHYWKPLETESIRKF